MTTHDSLAAAVGRAATALATATVGAVAWSDPDLFGHLRFGLDLLRDLALTAHDPYSFTQDVPWVNHEWLSELVFAAAYRVGGVPALVLLKSAMVLAIAWLLWPLTVHVTPWRRGLLMVAGLVGAAPAATTFRPQLWTLLLLAVLIRVLADRRSPLWLVLLFPVWANAHGGWIVGGGFAALWAIGRVLDDRSLRTAAPYLAAGAVAFLATAINPYGVGLWTFLGSTVRMGRDVTEWQPLWRQEDWSHLVAWSAVALLTLAGTIRGWRHVSWAALLPVAWLGLSGLFIDRLAMIFCEASILLNGQAWATDRSRIAQMSPQPRGRVLIDAAAVGLLWLLLAVPAARCLPMRGSWVPDITAAGALFNPDARGRLAVPFDWGQYAIWHWGPRLRVSMDGRRETVYSQAAVSTNLAMVVGEPRGLRFLEQHRPEYVWLPATSTMTEAWLRMSGYRIDVRTPLSFVAVRSDLPPLPPAPSAARCFP
ncbi:MAG: hypothetical protein AB7N65_11505 [Vicinamibacterales bacterium]